MLKSYSGQYLSMNLMKATQKVPCLIQKRMNLLLRTNNAVLNDLPVDLYTAKADDGILDDSRYA